MVVNTVQTTPSVLPLHQTTSNHLWLLISIHHLQYKDGTGQYVHSIWYWHTILWPLYTGRLHECVKMKCSTPMWHGPFVGQLNTLCLKKNIPDVFSYNSRKHWWIFIIFGRNVTEKASSHMLLYFPPHLINASTLPCETENTEIVSFHVNVACWLANRHTSHIGIIT